jgi:hypothetical protein
MADDEVEIGVVVVLPTFLRRSMKHERFSVKL